GSGTDSNDGVDVVQAKSLVAGDTGNIQIIGQGSTTATGGFNTGFVLQKGGQVTSTGTGAGAANITRNGTGGSGQGSNDGVEVVLAGSLVTSVTGNIQITGQGGTTATGSGNIGVLLHRGGQVTSTGAAAITLNGTGGSGTDSNDGVDVV